MATICMVHSNNTFYHMFYMFDMFGMNGMFGSFDMYGMWYFGELTKLCTYSLWFMVSSTSGSIGKVPT